MFIGFLMSLQLASSVEHSSECRRLMQTAVFQYWIDQMHRPAQLFTSGRSFVGQEGAQAEFIAPVSQFTRSLRPSGWTYEGEEEISQLRRLYFLFGAEPNRIATLLDEQLPYFGREAAVGPLLLIRARQFTGNPTPEVLKNFLDLLVEKDWVQYLAGEPESIFFWRNIFKRKRSLDSLQRQNLYLGLISAAEEHRRRAQRMTIRAAMELKFELTSGRDIFPNPYEDVDDFFWAQATHLDNAVELSRMAEVLATAGSGLDKSRARLLRQANERSLSSIQSRSAFFERLKKTPLVNQAIESWINPQNFP